MTKKARLLRAIAGVLGAAALLVLGTSALAAAARKGKADSSKLFLAVTHGTLSGSASADLTIIDAKGDAKLTNGKFSLTKGTSGQRGHSEVGTFTGTGNAMTGQYTLVTKGSYK
jgi:hypothetical protein